MLEADHRFDVIINDCHLRKKKLVGATGFSALRGPAFGGEPATSTPIRFVIGAGIPKSDLRKGYVSKRRNSLIADLFRRIEMVEAWGRGMPLIFKHEPDVEFKEIADIFIAAFTRPSFRSGFQEEHSPMPAEKVVANMGSTTQEKIFAILKARPETTRSKLASEIGITPDGIKYHLNKLRAEGVIRHVGPTKGGHWEVLK